MKTIKVELTGKTPILMNNPASMLIEKKARKMTDTYNPEDDAKKTAYLDKKGNLYVPSRCIYSMIISGAKMYKDKKQSMASLLAGTIRIEPMEILLGTKKYEIDIQRVVIQRAAIMKARARLDDWKINFDLIYDDNFIGNPGILKQILEDAGSRIGLLDYRPQKKGSYGTFLVTGFKEEKTK